MLSLHSLFILFLLRVLFFWELALEYSCYTAELSVWNLLILALTFSHQVLGVLFVLHWRSSLALKITILWNPYLHFLKLLLFFNPIIPTNICPKASQFYPLLAIPLLLLETPWVWRSFRDIFLIFLLLPQFSFFCLFLDPFPFLTLQFLSFLFLLVQVEGIRNQERILSFLRSSDCGGGWFGKVNLFLTLV